MGIIMLKKLFQEKEIRIFAIVTLVVGIIMSFLISPWQVPDENTHLMLIGYTIHNGEFADNIRNSLGMDQGRVEWIETEATNIDQWLFAMTKAPDYNWVDMLPKGISLAMLKYLPAIVGMELAIVLQLPTFWVMQFGELFSLLAYVLICSAALKACPYKKGIMAIFMISPMMMQEAGSITHDAMVIPLMFWIICYVLHLRYEKEEITLKDMVLLIVPWLLATYLKMPYVVIVLLGLMLPLKKFHVRIGKFEIDETFIKKYRWIALTLVILLMACVLYVLRDNQWIQILYGVVMEWPRTIFLLLNTLRTFTGHLVISSVGNFGWLNAPVADLFAIMFYVVVFGMALVGTDGSKKRLTKWDRSVVWAAFLALALLTVFSMINHTIMITLFGSESAPETYEIREALYAIPYVGGLQGRYFMPFISLFFMQLGSFEILDQKKTKILWGIFLVITYVYVAYVLLNRFWIG